MGWDDAERDDELVDRRETHEKKVRRMKKREDAGESIKKQLEEAEEELRLAAEDVQEAKASVDELEEVVKQKVENLRKEEEGKLAGEMAHIKRVAERASQKVIAEAQSRLSEELEATMKEAKADFVERLAEEKKNATED